MENIKEKNLGYLKHRILSYYNEAEHILKGEMALPRMAIFHPTYVCNHHCTGCDFRHQNSKISRVMSEKDSNNILDKLIKIGIQSVEFSGGGEPLLAPNAVQMIKKLKNKEVAVGLLTNGSKLKEEILDAVIKNCTYVRVSLESGSNEIFKKVKNVEDDSEFDNIVNNIKNALKLRKKLDNKIDISIKFSVGKDNYMDMENAINLAIELGVDSIQFKLYQNIDSIEIDSPKQVADKLNELKETYGNKILIIGNLIKSEIGHKCWLTPIITTVDALGDVYLCSYYRHRMDTHRIGNLLVDDFKTIWYSQRHKEAIKNIKIEGCNIYDCRFHFYNNHMRNLMEKGEVLKFI